MPSSPALAICGNLLQPSAQVAVCPCAIPTGFASSEESVRALTSLLLGLLRETLSGDALYLAIKRAESIAAENGVRPEEFQRMARVVVLNWHLKCRENPFSRMF